MNFLPTVHQRIKKNDTITKTREVDHPIDPEAEVVDGITTTVEMPNW